MTPPLSPVLGPLSVTLPVKQSSKPEQGYKLIYTNNLNQSYEFFSFLRQCEEYAGMREERQVGELGIAHILAGLLSGDGSGFLFQG